MASIITSSDSLNSSLTDELHRVCEEPTDPIEDTFMKPKEISSIQPVDDSVLPKEKGNKKRGSMYNLIMKNHVELIDRKEDSKKFIAECMYAVIIFKDIGIVISSM